MRILLAIVVLAALGWGGFWYFNASARDRALTGWLEQQEAAGWVAEAKDIRVTGFPNRVDTIVTGLTLADPKAGWSWQAPELQLLSQTWKPHRMIAVWPGEQTIATPLDTIRLTSDAMIGSLAFEPNTRVALDHSTIEMKNVHLTGETGWQAAISEALFSTRQSKLSTAPFAYDVDFNAKGLALPDTVMAAVSRAGALPGTIDSTHLGATLTFDRAWDRAGIEAGTPALRGVVIDDVTFAWGQLDLRGKGVLGVDARGFAEGKIDLTTKNWRGMLDAVEQSGMIGGGLAGTLRGALGLYARLSGGDELSLPLEFKDGAARLGPVPIGAAPVLARASQF